MTATEEELLKFSGKLHQIGSTAGTSDSALLHPHPISEDCPLGSRALNVHTEGSAGSFPAENRESNYHVSFITFVENMRSGGQYFHLD